MPPPLKPPGSGRRNTPDLSGAMTATQRLIEAMGSVSLGPARRFPAADAARGGEGSFGIDSRLLNAFTPPPRYFGPESSTTHPPVERYVRADGMIGVIVSHGYYNGGWSTRVRILLDPSDPATPARSRRMEEVALFDKEIVAAVLQGKIPQARKIAIAKMGLPQVNQFAFDQVQLSVLWVAAGEEFEVADSPGFERIRRKNLVNWWRA